MNLAITLNDLQKINKATFDAFLESGKYAYSKSEAYKVFGKSQVELLILCAGFPCQPFSKAGLQKGIDDYRGQMIDYIVEILRVHKTPYFILENVRNLERHNNGESWAYIQEVLIKLGYSIDKKVISPHQIGIAQHRERIFIVGSLNGLDHFR